MSNDLDCDILNCIQLTTGLLLFPIYIRCPTFEDTTIFNYLFTVYGGTRYLMYLGISPVCFGIQLFLDGLFSAQPVYDVGQLRGLQQ